MCVWLGPGKASLVIFIAIHDTYLWLYYQHVTIDVYFQQNVHMVGKF